MKLPILICMALSATVAAKAQIAVGPIGGIQLTRYRQAVDGNFSRNAFASRVVDMRLGAVADFPLHNRLHLQSGVQFTTNGFYQQLPGEPPYSFTVNAIEIPLFLSYHLGMKHQSHFFFSGGILANVNIGGSSKVTYRDVAGNVIGTEVRKLDIANKVPADIRRFGGGLGLNAGLQLKRGLFVRLHYQQGLINLYPKPVSDMYHTASNNYGLTIGYLFNTRWQKEKKDKEDKK